MRVMLFYKLAKSIPVHAEVKPTEEGGVKAEAIHLTDEGKGVEHKKVKVAPGELKIKKKKHKVEPLDGGFSESSESSVIIEEHK